MNSNSCYLFISYPLTKISVHQARADEEDIMREAVFSLRGTSFLKLSRMHQVHKKKVLTLSYKYFCLSPGQKVAFLELKL